METARATRTMWEVARVWRLGRRQYILYADPEDPYEDWAHSQLVREDATRSQTLDVPLAYYGSPYWFIGMCFPNAG